MISSYVGFFLSFLAGGTIVWIFLKTTVAKSGVPRTEFDHLNAAYRDSIVENVKLGEQISNMQERVEELNEKLLKADQELSIASDEKTSLKSENEILKEKLNRQKSESENMGENFKKK